ncbi:MAG: hypothetical protein GY847_09525 [Proteobacteria bacterium]|nr:hypothetical protein [Pseudomonadota bacterium]
MGAAIGQEIWLEVPESGIAGFGVVEAIEPSPAIGDGPGRVVLATIRVWSEDVVQVWLKGLDKPLEATADHPVYSVTREAWVGAGELLAGEEIWALGDTALVLEVDSKRGTYSVFNLEVEGEHVFFVSDLRVLSHNVSPRCPTNGPRETANSVQFGQRRVSPRFGKEGRPPHLAGREISEVAADLRAEILSPDDLPIEAFKFKGQLVSANTRSLSALSEAGLRPTNITIIEPSPQLLRRLQETPIIPNAPLPGPHVPVTPTRRNLTVLRIIELPN